MEDRTVFISSCSRRQLARRRPTRLAARMQLVLALVLLLAAAAVVATAQGVV
jgi:hypothetical protein